MKGFKQSSKCVPSLLHIHDTDSLLLTLNAFVPFLYALKTSGKQKFSDFLGTEMKHWREMC